MTSQQPIGAIVKALDFAARKHRQQRRKGASADPYINHPIALCHILSNGAGIDDPIVLMGALLHDTVEDTDTSFEELQQEFGVEVEKVVREVTDDKSLPKQTRKQLQIEHASHISDRAKLVKLADKISNLRDLTVAPPENWTLERRQEYFAWAKQVVDRLRGVNTTLEQLFDEAYQKGMAVLSAEELKVKC